MEKRVKAQKQVEKREVGLCPGERGLGKMTAGMNIKKKRKEKEKEKKRKRS